MIDRPRILFLGIHNAIGSQMAEALMRKRAGDRYEVYSAGVVPAPIDPLTIQVLEEAGCDMSRAYSKDFHDLISTISFSLVITVSKNIQNVYKFAPGSSMLIVWDLGEPPIDNATNEDRNALFHQLCNQIDQKLLELLNDLDAHHPRR